MPIRSKTSRRTAAICASGLFGGLALATVVAPSAPAAPDCSPAGQANTVSSVTGAARDYLSDHPGANQVVSAARTQPRAEASSNIRAYFTSNPQEYYELKGILAPIGDTQNACNSSLLSPDMASAYNEFMAG